MRRLAVFGYQLSVVSLSIAVFSLFVSVQNVLAAPPEGFQRSLIIGSGLNGPSGFEVAPDGRIFVLERTGAVKVWKNGVVLPTPFIELPSIASGDRGLIGIAFDPNFNENYYVYFYYTALDQLNYLVRVSAQGDVATEAPHILFNTTSPSELLHVGGSIRFGNDGKMYFAVGDNGNPPLAQRLDNPHGKIHRINADGTIPEDNPFYNSPGAVQTIWAYGFRNPWRFNIDPVTGFVYGGDVGDYSWEEVNKIEAGKNFGWPLAEGFCAGCGFENPLYAYSHDGFSNAVTGGPVYRSEMFPEMYHGNLFFADYARGFIRRMVLSATGGNAGVYDFDTQAGTVVDLKVANDGSLYYLTYYPGHLYRLAYSEGNSVPVVFAGSDVRSGPNPLTVNFSSGGTFDPDGDELSYLWDFGNGVQSTEANPTYTYNEVGRYEVVLTVADSNGESSQAIPLLIQAGIPPVVTIGTPGDNDTYAAGDTFTVTAHAVDAFGNDLSDGNYRTDVIFHHDTHTHPFLDGLVGRSNTFTIPDHGEADHDVWYRIRVTVSDGNGLQGVQEVNIYPRKSAVTINANIAGLPLFLDGKPIATPHNFIGVVNYRRLLSAPAEVSYNGQLYRFVRWNNDKPREHEFATEAVDATYTAEFVEVQPWNAEYFANQTLTGAPALTRTDNVIDFDWLYGSPDGRLPADGFSVRWVRTDSFVEGVYRLSFGSDDGIRVLIDGVPVVDRWFDQGITGQTVEVPITAGMHEVVVEYYENTGEAAAYFYYELLEAQEPEPVTPPDMHEGFVGSYYLNETLSGEPVLVRMDGVDSINLVDVAFGEQFVDNFSVRWMRHYHQMQSGMYRFCVTADDGVRVRVNDDLIIDQWNLQAPTEFCADKALTGEHETFVIEYFEHYGGATLQFAFERIGDLPTDPDPEPTDGAYSAKFWNMPVDGEPPYVVPTRESDAVAQHEVIDFDWGGDAPMAGVNENKFVAQWIKQAYFAAGNYRFTTTSDDGVRVWVNDMLVHDYWNLQAATTHSSVAAIPAGIHTVRVEYFDHYWDAVMRFSYELTDAPASTPTPSPAPSGGFAGEVWNMPADHEPPYVFPVRAADATLVSETIDFDWFWGGAASGINADKFMVRWNKDLTSAQGTYRFDVRSDDGVRVRLGDTLVIDEWGLQSVHEFSGTVTVAAGQYPLVVEYYEHTGRAYLTVDYVLVDGDAEPPAEPEPQTGFKGEYWNVPAGLALPFEFPTTAAEATSYSPSVSFDWFWGAPMAGIGADRFVARFSDDVSFEAGSYTFTTVSDDGVRVWVGEQLVIDQWREMGSETNAGEVTLVEGVHQVRVEYFENTGRAMLQMRWVRNE